MRNWRRLSALKAAAARAILPRADHVAGAQVPTVSAFGGSYSVGRMVVEVASEVGPAPSHLRVLIVGAWGGRDWHWLTGFGYRPDTLDIVNHPWAATTYLGDACEAGTWETVPSGYDLIVVCDVLEHLPRDYEALTHIRGALGPAGRLLLSVPFRLDAEPTHVRAYSDATLRRLLALAGFEVAWAKPRPGLLEAFPSLPYAVNLALGLACLSPARGGRLVARLLAAEYAMNDWTRRAYALFGRSPQRGMIYCCTTVEPGDYIGLQEGTFSKEQGAGLTGRGRDAPP